MWLNTQITLKLMIVFYFTYIIIILWSEKLTINDNIHGVIHYAKKKNIKINKKQMEIFYNKE